VKFVVIKIKSNVNNADCFHGYKLIKSLAVNTSRKKAFYFHVFERAAHEHQSGLSDAVDYCFHQRTMYSQHLRPEVRPEQEREKKINDQNVYVLEKNTCSCQSSPSAPPSTLSAPWIIPRLARFSIVIQKWRLEFLVCFYPLTVLE